MTFFDCTADSVGQLNGNGQKGMLQTDASPVENFWLRRCQAPTTARCRRGSQCRIKAGAADAAALGPFKK